MPDDPDHDWAIISDGHYRDRAIKLDYHDRTIMPDDQVHDWAIMSDGHIG